MTSDDGRLPQAREGGAFRMKSWCVAVTGYGNERIIASSRGKALAQAWRSDAFNAISFKQFLSIAKCWRAESTDPEFGDPITVEGKPAFYVGRNRQYVQIAHPDGDYCFSAHPYDIEPASYRPDAYRDAPLKDIRNTDR